VALFKDREAGDLSDARIRKYWVLEARTGEGVNVWMRLENGAPLLVERRIGKGRSLLLATTVDRDGADLCLQPAFIPWLERLLLHAAGRLRPALDRWAAAGRPVEFSYREPVFVEGPQGRKILWQPGSPPYVPATPGVYRVTSEGELVGSFVARIHPDESDLTRLASEDLDSVLGKENYSTSAADAESRGVAPNRKDVSTWFAVALLAAVCVEAALSTRWVRRRKTQILEA